MINWNRCKRCGAIVPRGDEHCKACKKKITARKRCKTMREGNKSGKENQKQSSDHKGIFTDAE